VKASLALVVAAALCAAAPACADRRGEGGADGTAALSIAAASDLRYALDELAASFEAEQRGVRVEVSYGSSGTFYAQILNGAPYDLFLSADIGYPRQLAERGLTVPGSEFSYGEGRIVVWVPQASPVDVETRGLGALTAPAVARVAIANPEHAPYGRAAEAALRSAAILEEIRPKLVLGENIAQTMQFVQSGAADAGIVALSLALAPPAAGGRYQLVPSSAHPPLEQGGAILRAATHGDAANAFRQFMLGPAARAVLMRYGFIVPEG
jgi:molybdate transport system substrate-binding protein